jgi:hypothetical protein
MPVSWWLTPIAASRLRIVEGLCDDSSAARYVAMVKSSAGSALSGALNTRPGNGAGRLSYARHVESAVEASAKRCCLYELAFAYLKLLLSAEARSRVGAASWARG